jgi:hypothetical protein
VRVLVYTICIKVTELRDVCCFTYSGYSASRSLE